MVFPLLLLTLGTVHSANAVGPGCRWQSSPFVSPQLEAYTANGSSDTPKIAKLMDRLVTEVNEKDFLALTFYVNYWEETRGADPLAKDIFEARHLRHKQNGLLGKLQVPQLLLSDEEIPSSIKLTDLVSKVKAVQSQTSPVTIQLSAEKSSPGQWAAQVNLQLLNAGKAPINGYLVVYENPKVEIDRCGENSSRKIKHVNLVRELYGPFELQSQNNQTGLAFSQVIEVNPEWQLSNIGLGVFVESPAKSDYLQSLNVPRVINKCTELHTYQ